MFTNKKDVTDKGKILGDLCRNDYEWYQQKRYPGESTCTALSGDSCKCFVKWEKKSYELSEFDVLVRN